MLIDNCPYTGCSHLDGELCMANRCVLFSSSGRKYDTPGFCVYAWRKGTSEPCYTSSKKCFIHDRKHGVKVIDNCPHTGCDHNSSLWCKEKLCIIYTDKYSDYGCTAGCYWDYHNKNPKSICSNTYTKPCFIHQREHNVDQSHNPCFEVALNPVKDNEVSQNLDNSMESEISIEDKVMQREQEITLKKLDQEYKVADISLKHMNEMDGARTQNLHIFNLKKGEKDLELNLAKEKTKQNTCDTLGYISVAAGVATTLIWIFG